MEHSESLLSLKKRMIQFAAFNNEELNNILNKFELKKVKSKTIIIEQGSTARNVYFIIDGSMRFFYNYDGKEITGAIFMENEFATPHDSFFSQTPTRYSLQAIEDTIMFELSFKKYNELRQKYPSLTELTIKVLEKALSVTLTNKSRLLILTHKKRYAKIAEDKPEWILRIPDYMLASYLGITSTSISRIKKSLHS